MMTMTQMMITMMTMCETMCEREKGEAEANNQGRRPAARDEQFCRLIKQIAMMMRMMMGRRRRRRIRMMMVMIVMVVLGYQQNKILFGILYVPYDWVIIIITISFVPCQQNPTTENYSVNHGVILEPMSSNHICHLLILVHISNKKGTQQKSCLALRY